MNSARFHNSSLAPHIDVPSLPRPTVDTQSQSHSTSSSPIAKAVDAAWSSRHKLNGYPTLPRSLSARGIGQALLFFLYDLIPSFIQSRLRREPHRPEKLHPTAYLDGLRGLAAFGVFLCHLTYQTFFITFSYGSGEPGENTWPIQLPIIRLFYSGPPMVAIFFVISGYALSYKPIRQMRARQYDGLMVTMSSAAFRRPFRLFLPCFASTFIVVILARLGAYEATAFFAQHVRAIFEDHPWTAPDFYTQVVDWAYKMFDFVHVFDWFIFGGSVDLDRHLWTIPMEFRSSCVLFITQLMVARMRSTMRILTILGLMYWALRWDRWELPLFWSGAILAELDLISLARASSNPPELRLDSQQRSRPAISPRTYRWFWITNFICGMFLMSYPDASGHDAPGYVYLTTLIPSYYSEKYRFWQSIGAVQLVWATNNMDGLKHLFTGPVVQYLGKISFALYLMHGPVIHTFGYMVFPNCWWLTGIDPRWRFESGFALASFFIIMAVIWAADVFWRMVDVPCVKFGRWLEGKLIVH